MNVKKIIEVCRRRQQNNLGCRRCEYTGKTCEHAINILRVDKPGNYDELNNKEETK